LKIYLGFAVSLISFGFITAETNFEPFSGPKPLLVWIQTNPWAMVIGSDTPKLVIYDDGTVIYSKMEEENKSIYFKTKFSNSELSKLISKVNSFGAFSEWESHYNLAYNVTDLPKTLLYLGFEDEIIKTNIYGLYYEGTTIPGYTVFNESSQEEVSLPNSLKTFYEFLVDFDIEESEIWIPKYIEVMIWPYEYAPQKSLIWPADWPSFDSEKIIKRRGGSYSIFIEGEKFEELKNFLSKRKPKGAVEIGGKKWAVAYRFTFPSEPIWRKIFSD
jgi:hypothetical protein